MLFELSNPNDTPVNLIHPDNHLVLAIGVVFEKIPHNKPEVKGTQINYGYATTLLLLHYNQTDSQRNHMSSSFSK